MVPFWTRFWFQAAVVAALAFALYANTLGNGYAFDDGVVIRENAYVQQGLAGIGNILTRDAFDSYFRQMRVGEQQLSGGRYRPLSIVTFALERASFGDDPRVRHLVNALLYAAAGVALLWLLRTQLLRDAAWAFLATLLFVVHPIHTEAVANIKGRDEILSFLFVVLTLAFALRHDERRRARDLVLALACCFLALLAKEYGLALAGLLPIAFFVANRRGPLEALRRAVPYFAVVAAYVAIRVAVVGLHSVASTEILSNPYLYATPAQALATKLAVLLHYLRLLFLPFPLSSDYSYRQIPYVDFTSPWPWLSLAIHAGLLAWGVALVLRRDARGFAVFFYLATLALVSNFVVEIGAFMGERLVFHASLGFVIVVAWALLAIARRAGRAGERAGAIARGALGLVVAGIAIAAGALTIDRNRDWKDDYTLFTHDVLVAPDSALLNSNAGLQYMEAAIRAGDATRRSELLAAAVDHLQRAIAIHPRFASAHINLGTAMFHLGRLDDAEREWVLAGKLRANDPMVERNLRALANEYLHKGLDVGSAGDFRDALAWFEKAAHFDPSRAVIWANVGKAHYWMKDRDAAREAFRRALELEPGRADALAGLAATGGKNP
jgi:tetratricopeptide (TPR) repeat protein